MRPRPAAPILPVLSARAAADLNREREKSRDDAGRSNSVGRNRHQREPREPRCGRCNGNHLITSHCQNGPGSKTRCLTSHGSCFPVLPLPSHFTEPHTIHPAGRGELLIPESSLRRR